MSSAGTGLQREQARSAPTGLFSSPEKRSVVLCLLLAVVTLGVYNPVTRNSFINWDDNQYVIKNSHVLAGLTWDTVKWSFTHYYNANWHPLTWLSHALDCQMFGLNAAGHHYVSLLFHVCNAVLLFLLFQAATGFTWRSLMLAALFALHPLNVESVAWAAERKNVLSMFFFLIAFHAYGWYARKPAIGRYVLVTFLFILGLMSKPQVITLPLLLLLWDFWPLGRFQSEASMPGSTRAALPPRSARQLIVEKVPLFLLCAIDSVITMQAQKAGGAVHASAEYNFHLRLENAILSYSKYILKGCWPSRLSVFYPHLWDAIRLWQVIASGIVILTVTGLVLRYRRQRYLCVGWLWYLVALVPMIGIVQVGEQAMADRYTYIPFLGLFLIACWGIAEWAARVKVSTTWLAAFAAAILSVFSVLTYRQIERWHDSITLWSYALSITPEHSYLVHLELGIAYDQDGQFDEAIPHLRAAIDPHDQRHAPLIHLGYGLYDQHHGHYLEAIEEYKTTIATTKDTEVKLDGYSNMASAYREVHDYEHARESFVEALKINPSNCMSLVGLGLLEQKAGNLADAIHDYQQAMSHEPTDVGYLLIAQAEAKSGHAAEAQAALDTATRLSTNLDQARHSVGTLLAY